MRKLWILLLAAPLLIMPVSTVAQVTNDKSTPSRALIEEGTSRTIKKSTSEIDSVILVINSDDLTQILVVTEDGRWINEARHVAIEMGIGPLSKKPLVKCTMYKGLFKPTNTDIQTWELKGMLPANGTKFQEILDKLQEGSFKP